MQSPSWYREAPIPVSYTHLDVYKRQVLSSHPRTSAYATLPPVAAGVIWTVISGIREVYGGFLGVMNYLISWWNLRYDDGKNLFQGETITQQGIEAFSVVMILAVTAVVWEMVQKRRSVLSGILLMLYLAPGLILGYLSTVTASILLTAGVGMWLHRIQGGRQLQRGLSVSYTHLYFTYLAAWGDRLGSNRLLPDNGADAEFIIQDGAILSRDGKILYGLLDSVGGIYAVPDKVEYIEEGAFAGSASLSTVILPDSVKSLNAQAMTGRQISCIICLGAEPPAIKGDSFDNLDVLQVQVPKGAGESYVDAWTQALGREKAEAIVTEAFNQMESKDGYTYLTQEDGAVLLKVPEDLVYFNGNELQLSLIHI